MVYQVVVHGYRSRDMVVDVATSEEMFRQTKVSQLMVLVAQKVLKSDSKDFTLMFASQLLEAKNTLEFYQIRNKSTLLMVVQLPGGH